MLLPRFEFVCPESLEEACAVLAAHGPSAAVVAGGTDLVVKMKKGTIRPERVVSLSRLRSGAPVTRRADAGLVVDPLATMSELARSPELRAPFESVAEGAASVGSPLVRNRATVGGNLVSARPCADTAPPLVCWKAALRLRSAGGERTLDLESFITGPGETGIRPDEILVSIEVEPPPRTAGSAFVKLIRRATLEVTIASAAVTVALDESGETIEDVRIALGSVAPVPLRAAKAEAVLRGERPDEERLAHAAAEAAREARPIDDVRGSAAYRHEMVEVLVRRAAKTALVRAGGAR
jgi:carbon-monoxide dehydrogenase medium subunit